MNNTKLLGPVKSMNTSNQSLFTAHSVADKHSLLPTVKSSKISLLNRHFFVIYMTKSLHGYQKSHFSLKIFFKKGPTFLGANNLAHFRLLMPKNKPFCFSLSKIINAAFKELLNYCFTIICINIHKLK